MHTKFRMRTSVAALAAAAAILGSVAISTGIADAAPGDLPAESLTLAPGIRNSSANFALGLPLNAACPGDASAGWNWGAFVAPSSADIGALFFNGGGIIQTPSGGNAALFRNLRIGGTAITNQPLNPVDGLLNPSTLNSVNLTGAALINGTYNLVVACRNDGVIGASAAFQVGKFWSTPITVAAETGAGVNNYNFGQPAAPTASVLSFGSVTPTGGVVNFTKPAAIPAVSSYTANVTPSGGTAVVNATAGTITLSGLTTGTPYSVELTSTNGQLPNNPSGSVTVTPANAVPPAPVATAISKAGKATINWTAPASGPTPIGYTVTFATAPGALPAPIVLGNVLTTGDVTLPVGDFSASVKATYAVSDFITAPLASNVVTFKSLPNALIEQEITVQRQQLNALILTQRCGVNSELPSEGPTARFPGVSVIPAVTGNGNPPTKTDPVTGLQVPVTNFTEYPIPVSPDYPTRCALNLSTPQLITSGALRGQYFTATGAINQVTVADFRDADNGWTLTGTMGNFTDGGSNSFPGNYLGWNPATPIVSPVTAEGYAQTVTSGANVQPGDGVGGTFGTTGGLGGGGVLATGASGVDATPLTGGTGIADLNARVKLLIPTTANAATYKGILTFTVA